MQILQCIQTFTELSFILASSCCITSYSNGANHFAVSIANDGKAHFNVDGSL